MTICNLRIFRTVELILVPFKIQNKKPKDKINHKISKDKKPSKMTVKTPDKDLEKFTLPPVRQKEELSPSKKEIRPPPKTGLRDESLRSTSRINKAFPKNKIESKISTPRRRPSNKGLTQKKPHRETNKPLSRELRTVPTRKKEIIPSTIGSQKSKSEKIINKLPPNENTIKSRQKITQKLPPTISTATMKNKKEKQVNKTPPKTIVQKTPEKAKTPPPTVDISRIPKITIRKKKPD
jgi:hypothetical protein